MIFDVLIKETCKQIINFSKLLHEFYKFPQYLLLFFNVYQYFNFLNDGYAIFIIYIYIYIYIYMYLKVLVSYNNVRVSLKF